MSKLPVPQSDNLQLDFFAPLILDLTLKDERETLERPFMCVSKRPTTKIIDYTSPDGAVTVKVFPHPTLGMATIQDWDIIIWATSHIWNYYAEHKVAPSRTIGFHPYNLLKAIGRHTGGKDYKRLRQSLNRLQGTQIQTSIRAKDQRGDTFSWLDDWTSIDDKDTGEPKYWEITLSKWIYEGIIDKSRVLTLDPGYFLLTDNAKRWLYRIARKHAGGQVRGFLIRLDALYEKSGKIRSERQWKHEIKKKARNQVILGYSFDLYTNSKGEEIVHMIRADLVEMFRDTHYGVSKFRQMVQKNGRRKKRPLEHLENLVADYHSKKEVFVGLHSHAVETVEQIQNAE